MTCEHLLIGFRGMDVCKIFKTHDTDGHTIMYTCDYLIDNSLCPFDR